jgi:hypothetical protein
VGPTCQWQCRATSSPDWLLWVAVSECAGRLKSRSDSAVRTAAVRTHARAPDRATARVRFAPRTASRPPSAVPTAAVRRHALARSEAYDVASEPSTPPSTPLRCSLPVVAESPCRRRPRSPRRLRRHPRFGEPRHVFPARLPGVGEAPP